MTERGRGIFEGWVFGDMFETISKLLQAGARNMFN